MATQRRMITNARAKAIAARRALIIAGMFALSLAVAPSKAAPTLASTYRQTCEALWSGDFESIDPAEMMRLFHDQQCAGDLARAVQEAQARGGAGAEEIASLYGRFLRQTPSAELLHEFYAAQVRRYYKERPTTRANPASSFAWGLAWSLMGACNAYELYGDERFLDLVVQAYDSILEQRDCDRGFHDEFRARSTATWGGYSKGAWRTSLAWTARLAYPALRFSLLVQRDPALRERYGDRAQRYVAVMAEALQAHEPEYRLLPEEGAGYYLSLRSGDPDAHNHVAPAGACFVILQLLTGEQRYLQRVREMEAWFRSCVDIEENGAWSWPYVSTLDARTAPEGPGIGEYVFKAQVSIFFPVVANRHGVAFSDADLEGIARTLTRTVRRPAGEFFSRIRLNSEDDWALPTQPRPVSLLFWSLLLSCDAQIESILIDDVLVGRAEMLPGGWFTDRVSVYYYTCWALEQRGDRRALERAASHETLTITTAPVRRRSDVVSEERDPAAMRMEPRFEVQPAPGAGGDVQAPLQPLATLRMGSYPLARSLAVEGDRLFVAANRRDILELTLPSGEIVRRYTHSSAVVAVALSDGRLVAGAADGLIRVWDRTTGSLVHECRLAEGSLSAMALAGDRVVAAGRAVEVHAIGAATPPLRLAGHEHRVRGLAASGDRAVSASQDGSMRIWDLSTGRALHVEDDLAPLGAAAIDGDRVWCGDDFGRLDCFPLAGGESLGRVGGEEEPIIAILTHADYLVVASEEAVVWIRDRRTGRLLNTITLQDGASIVTSLAIGGDTLAIGTANSTIHLLRWRDER